MLHPVHRRLDTSSPFSTTSISRSPRLSVLLFSKSARIPGSDSNRRKMSSGELSLAQVFDGVMETVEREKDLSFESVAR